MVVGVAALLVAADLIHVDPRSLTAPRWIIGTVGALTITVSLAVLFRPHHATSLICTAMTTSLFAIVLLWVGLYANPDHISGGFPFLSAATNGRIGKAGFGFMGLLVTWLAVMIWRDALRALRHKPPPPSSRPTSNNV